MQFQKKTSGSTLGTLVKFLIKLLALILVVFIAIILIDRINFPSPNKKIEKTIPNENFKVIK